MQCCGSQGEPQRAIEWATIVGQHENGRTSTGHPSGALFIAAAFYKCEQRDGGRVQVQGCCDATLTGSIPVLELADQLLQIQERRCLIWSVIPSNFLCMTLPAHL